MFKKTFSLTLILITIYCFSFISGCSGSVDQEIKSAEDRFKKGKSLYDEKNYFDAIQEFEIVRLQYQGSSVSDQAQYYTGMSHFMRGGAECLTAAYDFELLIRNYPSSKLVPDAYYMIAKSYVGLSPQSQLDQSYTLRALDALQTYIELYPTHEHVPEAQKDQKELIEKLSKKEYETGVLYERLENYKSALLYYDRVLDQYYTTPYADDALVAKIRILIMKKRVIEAQKAMDLFYKKFSDSPLKPNVDNMKSTMESASNNSEKLKVEKSN